MKIRIGLLVILFCLTSPVGFGQLPDYYKSVDALIWVVDNVETTVDGWSRLGFPGIQKIGEVETGRGIVFRGSAVFPRYQMAVGRIGETAVYWVKPLGGGDAFEEFHRKHGSGVFSLVHLVPSLEGLESEISRLNSLGVGVLQRGEFATATGVVRYVFLDTEPAGKYVLGLVAGDVEGSSITAPPAPADVPRITQYAFAVREMEPVSRYWARLGFPAMEYTHPDISELRYKDQPGDFDMRLGWQRHGKVPYEWTQSLKGPNVYLDHLEKHGEGVHHIAFNVEDMDKEVARWEQLGFPYSMGGAWGAKGKPGSGRFVYVNTQPLGGTDVELLWSFKAAR